jgi:hypothetical protein
MGDADGRDETLRFERAEYATGEGTGAPGCGFCKEAIASVYFQIDDTVACPRCRTATLRKREGGSGFGRFARATLYGSLAGAAGAAIWYAVRALTGYEVGLIALAVGLMVGAAVRAGSARRGGWRYQALAMALTYLSIVSTYVPMIVKDFVQGAQQAETTPAPAAAPATAAGEPAAVPASVPSAGERFVKSMSAGEVAFALAVFAAVVLALAMALPFLGGLQSIIGLVIIAIGLYEAWKLNRREPLVITGPHRVGKPLDATAGG